MTKPIKLLQEGRKSELWERYCGFINLSLNEFMGIQKRLLMEQLSLLRSSKIGQSILGENLPQNIDEFRKNVPLSTYVDYEAFLEGKNDDYLPIKPYDWARSSGRSGGGVKWAPLTKQNYDKLADSVIGAMIMSSCSTPGDVKLQLKDRILLATAPPPFFSGYVSRATNDQLDVRFLPPLLEGEKMDFSERIAIGFKQGMRDGVDYFYGVASVLARMGAQFEETSESNSPGITLEHLHPLVLWRLTKAVIKSKLNNNKLLPKDIWKLKGVMAGGTDTEIYRDKIKYYWGLEPLEGYGSSEGGTMCMQSWNFKGMTFFPDTCFLEFIPMGILEKNENGSDLRLSTVLFDELETGIYELVFTNFHGGVFVRYRIGDLFEVISIGDEEIGSELPQVRYYARSKDIIDIGSMARFSEKDIWKAIEDTGINYFDWVARKEIVDGEPCLHIYIEINPGTPITESETFELLDKHLSIRVSEFLDYKTMLNHNPLKVSILKPGSFAGYMEAQQKAGADLGHYKPPHMQPKDHVLEKLMAIK